MITSPSASVTIVGLGPGDPELRTIGAQRALDGASSIILRTRIHPGIEDLVTDPRVSDCDDLYQHAERFSDLYADIAERVLRKVAAGEAVVYAVPGHPRCAEQTVSMIEAIAGQRNISVCVMDAVSFIDAAIGQTRADPVASGLQIVDAEQLVESEEAAPFGAGQLRIDPTRPLLVAQLYCAAIAASAKLALARIYPEDHEVMLLQAAGISQQSAMRALPLHELDRHAPDHLTSLWVPPLDPLQAFRATETLTRIVARLRMPDGCPWDRAQTHASLRNAVLEEAYETVDAIDGRDASALAEELGDLLLLVAMHAQLAEEAGDFTWEDVCQNISTKLIRRHPHVFGDVKARTPSEVIATWEAVKARERMAEDPTRPSSRFDRLPRSMPATRKVIELLAPHRLLSAPESAIDGDELLGATEGLLNRGLDPDLALEAALKARAESLSDATYVGATPRQINKEIS